MSAARRAAQTAAIEEPLAAPILASPIAVSTLEDSTVKDLSTYALCFAAVITAAIAVAGMLTTTIVPSAAAKAEPQAAAVHTVDTRVAATMNIPF